MSRSLAHRLILAAVIAALLLPAAASAQTGGAQAYINDVFGPSEVQGPAGLPGLSLELNFSLLDANRQVIQNVGVLSATLQLASGTDYPSQPSKLETPWSIAVLVDASHTLGIFSAQAAFSDMRKDVANAMGSAPDGSLIGVYKFDSKPTTLLDLSRNKQDIDDAIRKKLSASTSSGPSCLLDGVFDTIVKLSKGPSGRRALLIVTASADSCATRLPADVVSLAQSNHIEIYAVGLLGYTVSETNLTALTDPTGGLTEMREQAQLKFGLDNIVLSWLTQYAAKFTMYPPAGQEKATLQLTLTDLTQVTTRPVAFTVSKDFAQPAQLRLRGAIISIKDGIRFGLDTVSPQLISQLKLKIISKKTGLPVTEQELPGLQASYDVPVNNLNQGEGYTLQVVAFNSSGQGIADVSGDFEYQPPQSDFAITKLTPPTIDSPQFEAQVQTTNLDAAVKFKAWVQHDGQDAQPLNVVTVPVGDPIQVPTTNLDTGDYLLGIQALDKDNTALAQVISPKIRYDKPSSTDLALKWIKELPVAITGITVVGCLAFFLLAFVVWMLLPKRAAKPKTVEMVVPELRRRAPPVNLASDSVPPRQPAPRPVPRPSPPVERAAPRPPVAAAVPAAGLPKACLTALAPASLRVTARITRPSFTLGRRDGNDLVLAVDNKVRRFGPSRHHQLRKRGLCAG